LGLMVVSNSKAPTGLLVPKNCTDVQLAVV
jgi:hypothetical protein